MKDRQDGQSPKLQHDTRMDKGREGPLSLCLMGRESLKTRFVLPFPNFLFFPVCVLFTYTDLLLLHKPPIVNKLVSEQEPMDSSFP